ncbi:MAG: hypothetical protein RQ722_00455 [Desulfuromonadales bacterium]|nr:hypothetical protein [Desulfuromonadales bacterium]
MTKGNNRKKIVIYVMSVLLLSLSCSAALAVKGPQKVENTVHNLSWTSPEAAPGLKYGADETWICVFCHTPHGGSLEGPLWNHETPDAAAFTHYNSTTLSGTLRGLSANRVLNDESLLCMSCHDGSVSVYSVHNLNNDRGGAPYETYYYNPGDTDLRIVGIAGASSARIGGNPQAGDHNGTKRLEDDHPVSFSYQAVWEDPVYQSSGAKYLELNDPDSAVADGVRFFGATKRMECSSCHDPHVDYTAAGNTAYAPFLITPNANSAMCLACHNK